MKRIILGIALVVSACSGVAAESSVWKAQKDNSVIYLGGTSHLLRETDYPLPAEFDQAYKASEIVVFETDVGKINEPVTQQKLLVKAMYADGSTIEQHLSAKAYGELSAYCDANGIPLAAFSRLKPAMLLTTLTIMELMNLGVSQRGVDQFYYDLAKKEGKAVAGLETADEQINFLVSMADGIEDDFVTYSLKDMKNLKEQFEILATAWRRGDAEKLAKLMITELKTRQPQLYRKLITERNRNWLPMIDAYQKTLRTEFILVGVAHLVGPDGLIATLRKKGYRVDKL